MLEPSDRLALYMQGALKSDYAKMGLGILRYSTHDVACVIDSDHASRDVRDETGVPRSAPIVATVEEAVGLGSTAMVLAIAPSGGLVPTAWFPAIDRAVELGLSIVNGLHDRLGERYATLRPGQRIWDIRIEPKGIGVATRAAAKLDNVRLLAVGTDMAVGKMTACLEVVKTARERGIRTEFVATGQIGISITGSGIPLDAIRVDYACGAVEKEVLARSDAQLIVVEGQGALVHPGSTSTLPLLRGSCPTHLLMCHRAGQETLVRMPEVAIPPLGAYARLYEDLAECCGAFPRPTTIGVSLNTFHLTPPEAAAACKSLEDELGVPCVDPVRSGAARFVDGLGVH